MLWLLLLLLLNLTTSTRPPPTLRPKIEAMCPDITTLKDWQWEFALQLVCDKTSVFLMMPCGSGKTYIWIAISILLAFYAVAKRLSHDVIIVYAPLNEIIRDQIQKVRSIKGWHAWNFADDPDRCEQALTVTTLLNPTIIFWNPHERTWERFLKAIQNSIPFRIKTQVADEAGTLVDWGSSDTFRSVLRQLKLPIDAWHRCCQKKDLPVLVMTGAASPRVRQEIKSYFLENKDSAWGFEEVHSPLKNVHVSLQVQIVKTREQESSVVKKGVGKAAVNNPPPSKLLILVPHVKQLDSTCNQLLNALNPNIDLPISSSVLSIFAGPECVNGQTDLVRFTDGRDGRNRCLVATASMVATGWNCHNISDGWMKGQTNNVELFIQAMFRIARGGLLFGTFVVVASWFRRLELQFHAFLALTAPNSTLTTRRTAERQQLEIDELSFVFLFPDGACLLCLIDKLIMGNASVHTPCSTHHGNDRKFWCSSCDASETSGLSMIHKLKLFHTNWCVDNEKEEPAVEDWSLLIDPHATGDCVAHVTGRCLKEFVESLGEKTTNRAGNIETIRKLMDPVRLTQTMVANGLNEALPSSGSVVNVATLKALLLKNIPKGTDRLVNQCVQRLLLKQVLKDRPPSDALSKEQAAANSGKWLVERGEQFRNFREWPLLQPPPHRQSRMSRRGENKRRQGTQKGGSEPPKKQKKKTQKKKVVGKKK